MGDENMKKIVLLLIACVFVCFVSSVYADANNVSVYSFNVFNDNTEYTSADWDNENIEAYPGQTLDVRVVFENNWNDTFTLYVNGILYLDNNIQRDTSVSMPSNQQANHRKTVVLSYLIPSNTRQTIYTLSINYKYTLPGYNQTSITRDFDVRVIKPQVNQNDYLLNITQQLAETKADNVKLMETITNLSHSSNELTDCKTELATLKVNSNWSSEFKQKYESQCLVTNDYKSQLDTCLATKTLMFSSDTVENEKIIAENKGRALQKKSDDFLLFIVVAGAVGYIWMKKKKETVGGQGTGVSLKGATWK